MNSCYKCTDRHVGCHADCAKYAADSIKREEAKAALKAAKVADSMMRDYMCKALVRKGVVK